MTTAIATIPARPAARKDLAAFFARCTMEQLVFLAYEACYLPEYDDCPDWFFDACYDAMDSRQFDGPDAIANTIQETDIVEVAPPARRIAA